MRQCSCSRLCLVSDVAGLRIAIDDLADAAEPMLAIVHVSANVAELLLAIVRDELGVMLLDVAHLHRMHKDRR